jgi:hypothetical protein
MVRLVLLLRLSLAALYPAESVKTESPLGRYEIENVDIDEGSSPGDRHELYLLDKTAKSRSLLTRYSRFATVTWAPDRNAVAVEGDTEAPGGDVVVFEVDSGAVRKRTSLLAVLLSAQPELAKALAMYPRRSLGMMRWREGGIVECRLWVHDNAKGFGAPAMDEGYLVGLDSTASKVVKALVPAAGAPGSGGRAWRRPSPAELSEAWRDRDKDRFAVAIGDFDGDGKRDEARLVVSEDGQLLAVEVRLSRSGKVTVIDQIEGTAPGSIVRAGIGTLRASKYTTACGRGYYECPKGDSGSVTLKSDGIAFYFSESASYVLYLPPGQTTFRHVRLSD